MAWRNMISGESKLPEKVMILDTTLRDGEQTPGVALTIDAKMEIAKALDELGVDVIEAGFPIVSRGEEEAVKRIVKENLDAEICVLARAERRDIDKALECDVDWIHVFIATSNIHLTHKLKMTREEVLKKIEEAITYAKDHGVVVHFSAEDATRTDLEFLVKVFKVAEESGADSVDIPDTVGFAIPIVMKKIVSKVRENVKIPVAVHCHDDMGLAVANSLAGVEAGAEIVHVTINGIGERAGNASLEEVVVSLHTLYGVKTNVKLEKIYELSRLVEKLTEIIVPKNKAIVGENAFSHESGIHVHGVISSPETYEPIDPSIVGRNRKIIIGKHSGRHSIEELSKQFGIRLTSEQTLKVLMEVKKKCDQGIKMTETEFLKIIEEVCGKEVFKKPVDIRGILVENTLDKSIAILSLNEPNNKLYFGVGRNQLEAFLEIFKQILMEEKGAELKDYKIWFAQKPKGYSESEVILSVNGLEFIGRGVHPDPYIAFAQAFINAFIQSMQRGEANG